MGHSVPTVIGCFNLDTDIRLKVLIRTFCLDTNLSLSLVQKLRPRGLELQQGELGDLVEQEMAATSAAVESAATRIEVHDDACVYVYYTHLVAVVYLNRLAVVICMLCENIALCFTLQQY